ncbi:MAG: DUF2007 domain-containing protein [Parvularculaceae bacterium]|nr:DUF2007 domain-containing protein [Parvularculaceae bacterium]
MNELIRTNDPALISFVEALLTEAGFRYFIADAHMSAVDGSIGALPRRILVESDQETQARRLLADADLAHELRPRKT